MAAQTTVADMVVKVSMDTSGFEKEASGVEKSVDNLGKSTSKAFSSTGASAESALTKVIAKAALVVDVLKKIGAAVKHFVVDELVKGSYNAAAAYEQLAGGTKLMLGDAFDFVRERSLQAFESAGLSANEYLQQVNGLATGLKTALGGDEMAAARLADRVITAEADIVAATGNSQEAVQNAFNGIMKSNYTMLDNLQIGIKPTKEGFQEMIDTVNAWNAANGKATSYQIDNLADAQSALVDYIEMQKLSGYAAREASTTIEGALSRMRAAWENVKLAIGGKADLAETFSSLGESIHIWINNAAPQFANVVANIGRSMIDGIPRVMEDIGTAIAENFPKIAAGIGILLLKIVQLVLKGIGTLMQSITNGIAAFGRWLINYDWKGLISGVWDKVSGAVETGWNSLTGKLKNWVGSILQWLENLINEKLNGMINSITDGLPDFVKDALGLKGGSNIHVDLGSSQLLGDTKPNAGKEDATVRELKKVNRSIVQGDKANLDALQWFDTAENFLQSVIDANGGTEYAVNKQGGDITDAVKGSGGTGVAEGEKTAYDVVTELMNQWNPGTYDDNLAKEIQAALDLLQVHDQWIHNAELIDTGEIPPEVADYLKKHSADEVYKQIDEQGLKNTITGVPDGLATDTSIQGVADAVEGKDLTVENDFDTTGLATDDSVKGVTQAVDGKNWSPTIEAPALDPAPIASAISNVKVEPSIKATVRIPEIEVPEANVDVAVDTSILDTSATNLSGSATSLDTSASNLDTSATNLSSLATPQDILQAYEGTTYTQNKWNVSGNVPGQKGAQQGTQQQGGALQTVQQISVPEIPAVPDEVLESYQNLLTAIQNLNTAFQNLMTTLSGAGGVAEGAGGAEAAGGEAASAEGAAGGAGSSLTEVLSGLPGLFDKVQAAAQTLASYFTGEFIASINTMLEILCVTSVDEEGNIDAGGGNTLYTAMGSIYGLFRDTFVTTQDLGNYWSSTFVGQINTLREQCGIGKSATQGLADAASTAATAYANLAGAIMMAVSALQQLNSVKDGGAGKINPSPGTSPVGPEGAAANGAHVRAGETWLVGEEGPELFTPHRDGYIIPNDELRGGSRTVDDRPINITIEGSVYGESYLKNYVVNTLTTTVKKELRLAAA